MVGKLGSDQIAEYEAKGNVEVEYKVKGSGAVERETLQAGEIQACHTQLISNRLILCCCGRQTPRAGSVMRPCGMGHCRART